MRVAVFGAGYAGVTVARRLERRLPAAVELVVVDESPDHLVQHELHRVVRRPALAEVVTVQLEDLFSRAEVREATVTDLDVEGGVATLTSAAGTEELPYDFAAVCLGATTEFYGLSGVEEHAIPLKQLADAHAIRRQAMAAPGGRAVVGGGGLSGVQVAGELAALSDEMELDLGVTVVERSDRLAAGFDPAFSSSIERELEVRDITIEPGATVESADAEHVTLGDGRSLPYDVFVWTGGIRGPPALDEARVPVEADLRVSESTFVVGDTGSVTDADGQSVPASAQTAVREARVAARNLDRLVRESMDAEVGAGTPADEALSTYRFQSPGWVVSVGDGAVAQLGPVVLSGEPAKAAKAVVGAGHLGSVGAVRRASELVGSELGWPTSDATDVASYLSDVTGLESLPVPTDPGSPGELEYPLALTAFALAERFTPGNGVDLTLLTRAADREYPGSPANLLDDLVCDTFEVIDPLGVLRRSASQPARPPDET